MHKYRLISKKGEGTFSVVFRAKSIQTGRQVAIKCMKTRFSSLEQVNNLREIQALRRLCPHPHIVKLLEILYDEPSGRLALVFELMSMNLYEWIKQRKHYLPEKQVKTHIFQLLKALDHMHRKGVFHRDIKPENVLLNEDSLKLADFGSCKGVYSKQPYTEYISTRWYRSPECLLTDGHYNSKMDIWGVGCVFFEISTLYPLFPGENELDQVHRIHQILGTPPPAVLLEFETKASHMEFKFTQVQGTGIQALLPHISLGGRELIELLLQYTCEQRISAKQALEHTYFNDLREQDQVELLWKSPPGHVTPEKERRGKEKLPPVKGNGAKRAAPLIKNNAFSKRVNGIGQANPYLGKKIKLQARKPYVSTYRKGFYNNIL